MVMVSPALNPQACWEFEGEILVLHHPTTISSRYQAMVHCGSIRQTASILSMSKDCLRTGDKALIHFRFIKHPEYMTPGQRMVFREGRTKAVGNVIRTITQTTPTHQNNRSKQNKQQRYGSGHHSQRNEKNVQQMFNNENTLQELSEMGNTSNDSPFEARSDKRDTTQKPGIKKGRSRRGGRGKGGNSANSNTTKPLPDVTNITPVSYQSTARVQRIEQKHVQHLPLNILDKHPLLNILPNNNRFRDNNSKIPFLWRHIASSSKCVPRVKETDESNTA
ncbi:hypothetical protein NQ317_019038 [Molorchus minor]|uniref:GTP-binding protein 1 n=1 Tax=Molorchus minor TaxID=1323400 RepID=A0ABQ9IRZ4_9CUCU|nr:hypothetical protein NQ317_019038 [Molorchus minor]